MSWSFEAIAKKKLSKLIYEYYASGAEDEWTLKENRSAFSRIFIFEHDIAWFKTITHLPILVKGVVIAEDAKIAVQTGASGITVSNHGARQLDYVPATIMALEEVVQAVQGKIPVFLDGGVRRGTDVFKALALGASDIFVGRPIIWSLAADGEAGVSKALQSLREEFELTMALSGCRSLKEIMRRHVAAPWDRAQITPRL
ncbi:hypothetical protein AgCh_024718 [Apium graveolens]